LQLLLFQIHLYLILVPTLNFYEPLLYIHFLFVLVNSCVIEVGRKIKVKANESTGKDTYSSRMGKKKAIWLFLAIIILSFLLFAYIFFLISPINYLFLIAVLFLLLEILSLILYLSYEKVWVEKILEGTGVLFYLSLHIILFLGGIL
jgi:4-hydroxybenzoate polyprenyltransferase